MISKNLKYYRLKNNLSIQALAEIIHVSPDVLAEYESGAQRPSMDVIRALAAALHIKVSDLLARWDSGLTITYGQFWSYEDWMDGLLGESGTNLTN